MGYIRSSYLKVSKGNNNPNIFNKFQAFFLYLSWSDMYPNTYE